MKLVSLEMEFLLWPIYKPDIQAGIKNNTIEIKKGSIWIGCYQVNINFIWWD